MREHVKEKGGMEGAGAHTLCLKDRRARERQGRRGALSWTSGGGQTHGHRGQSEAGGGKPRQGGSGVAGGGGDRDLITPGYAPAGAMLTRRALAGLTRF